MHGSSINRLDRLEYLISLKHALPTGNHLMLMWLPTWTSIRFNHNRLAKRMTRSQRHNRFEALKCSVGKPCVFAISPSHFFPEDVEHSYNVPQRLLHVDVPKYRCNRQHLHDAGSCGHGHQKPYHVVATCMPQGLVLLGFKKEAVVYHTDIGVYNNFHS